MSSVKGPKGGDGVALGVCPDGKQKPFIVRAETVRNDSRLT